MKTHKDLPGGSQAWAGEVDALMAEVKALREAVKRLSENAGIDMANPKRGINAGDTPSIKNPVGQKLSSLADVGTYNVAEGQVLTWSQQGQKWLPVTPSSGAFAIPLAIAGFENAFGYGYLPTVADGPYSVLAQSADEEGNFNLIAHTVNGPLDSYQSVFSNDGSLSLDCYGGGGTARLGLSATGEVTLNSFTTDGSALELFGAEWELGYNNGTSNSSRIYSYRFTSMKIQDDAGVEIIGKYFKLPGCTTAARPSTLGPGDKGAMVFDFDLGIPIVWKGSVWANALGTAV